MTKSFNVGHLLVPVAVVLGVIYFNASPSEFSTGQPPAAPAVETALPAHLDYHDLADLSRVSEADVNAARRSLERTGCKRVLDYRFWIPDLRRSLPEVSKNKSGNRVCTWDLKQSGVMVVIVDKANGLVDHVTVVFDANDKLSAIAGKSYLTLVADGHSIPSLNKSAIEQWLTGNANAEGATERFGMATLRVIGIDRSDGHHYVGIRVS